MSLPRIYNIPLGMEYIVEPEIQQPIVAKKEIPVPENTKEEIKSLANNTKRQLFKNKNLKY